MTGLPKKYAKMGFSKGWKAYRKSSSSTKISKRYNTMARRKRFGRKSSRHSSGMNGLMSLAVGVAGAIVYEKYVSPMIPIANPMAHGAVDVAAGYALTKVNNSYAKSAGNAIMIINLFGLGQQLLGASASSTNGNADW